MPLFAEEIPVSWFAQGRAVPNSNNRPATQNDGSPSGSFAQTEADKSLSLRGQTPHACSLVAYAPWWLEANYAQYRGGGSEGSGNWSTSGATPEWPQAGTVFDGTSHVTSVGWVPNVGFVASAPRYPLTLVSQDGLTWSPASSALSLGGHAMMTLGGRLYAIESTVRPSNLFIDRPGAWPDSWNAGVAFYPQLVVATADTYPNFYSTDAFFEFPPSMPNGIDSNETHMFVVEQGANISRVPLLPPYDPRASNLPLEPLDVSVGSAVTHQTAVVSWTAPEEDGTSAISEYVLQVTSDGGATWALLTTTTPSLSLSRTITGLTNGTQYMFRVAAVNASGRGPFSVPSAPYTPAPATPSAPLSVTATPVGPKEDAYIGGAKGSYNVRFRIDWTQSGDGGSPVTGYIIRRFPYELEVGRLTSASTTFTTEPAATVRVFSPGDSVQFEVIAINASGESAPSAPSQAVILR